MKTRLSASQLIPAIACAACLVMCASAAYSVSYNLSSQRFGGAGSDVAKSVAIDASGNVYVTGSFQGTVNFGGSNLVSAGGSDIFLAKYSVNGVHQWSLRVGGASDDQGNCVALNQFGNVYVTGSFQGTADFGGGNVVSAGGKDIFLAKYSTGGVFVWNQRWGAANADEGKSVAVYPSGGVLVTGYFNDTVSFGGNPKTSAGGNDIFFTEFDGTGLQIFTWSFGSTGVDEGASIAIDAASVSHLTGSFEGSVSFGGTTLVSAGSSDIFVVTFNAGGIPSHPYRFGSSNADFGRAVAVDASGDVFLTGTFQGTVNFAPGNLGPYLVSAGSDDIFVAKYNASDGSLQWSQRFGSTGPDVGLDVAVDPSGSVFVTGAFQGTVNFGGGNLVSAGGSDVFVARYSTAGAHQLSLRAGGISDDIGYSAATDAAGNVITTGSFQGTVDFGAGNLVSAGTDDIFVAKYALVPMEPSISSIADVGNDEGRQVKIRFGRSGRDQTLASPHTVNYEAYRRDDPPPAASVVGTGALSRRQLLDLGWTFAGEVPAHGQLSYGLDAPTIGDSTIALGPYNSTFFIRAATNDPLVFFDSPSASGYSLDNLAPPAPQNFAFVAGNLSWNESTAKDFDYFTVYGSNADNFGAATVIDYSVAAAMNVNASPYVYYYVTATDFAGNEGKHAKVNTLSGVGGTPKSYVLSVSNYPNPFNPRTTVSYTVPSRGPVTITIYDANGARVATLLDHADRTAGAYTVDWDGWTGDGDVAASGVYFARIDHSSGTRSKKMVLLK